MGQVASLKPGCAVPRAGFIEAVNLAIDNSRSLELAGALPTKGDRAQAS